MGFKISWLAFEGVEKSRLLDALGFHDTAVEDEANESPFSAAQLKNGWSVIWSNDFGWVDTQTVRLPFPSANAIACQIHEGIMYSAAHGSRDGVEVWSVSHDSQEGLYDLQIAGMLPPELNEVKDSLFAQQKAEGSEQAGVDFIFEVPVELAYRIVGYRHDLWEIDGVRPTFTVVEKRT